MEIDLVMINQITKKLSKTKKMDPKLVTCITYSLFLNSITFQFHVFLWVLLITASFCPVMDFSTVLLIIDGYNLVSGNSFFTLSSGSTLQSALDQGDPDDPCVRLKRDCVGIMAVFKLKNPSNHIVIVANTHLYW